MLGIDISTWQTVSDYGAAARACKYILLKAGGSNSGRYTDSKYARHASGFAPHGVPIGSYWMNGSGPVATDAAYFLSILRADARSFAALDIETIDGHGAWNPGQAIEWFRIVKAALPGVPLFAYMNSSQAAAADWRAVENLGVRLWVANYGPNNGNRNGTPSIGSWSTYAVHQYTDKGSHPGIPGLIDLNHAPRIFWEEDDMFTDQDRANLNALASGSLPNAKGYPFPARDAVQNNLEAIITLLRQVAKNDSVDEKALGEAIAGAIRPVVEAALKDVAPGASAKQIADELGKRLAA